MLQPYRYPSLRIGCVGEWCPSQGATGFTLLDRSGYNNHGTLTNMDANDWVASGSGLALDFTEGASSSKVSTANMSQWSNQGSSRWSVSFWVCPTAFSATNFRGYLSRSFTSGSFDAWMIGRNGSGNIVVWTDTSGGATSTKTSSRAMVLNVWHHIVLNAQFAGNYELYINGALDSSGVFSTTDVDATFTALTPLNIGIGYPTGAYTAGSRIDSIAAYSRWPSTSEIATLALRRGIAYERVRNTVARRAIAAFNRRRRLLMAG